MDALTVKVAGVEFRNPFLLASGIWGESGASLHRAYVAGAGGVVTKSIGREPRTGYPNPTIERLDDWGLLNAMGLPNPGIKNYAEEVRFALSKGVKVVGSVFGGTPEEFALLSVEMEKLGVGSIELNLSCPHAKGYGSEIGADPELLSEVVRAVKKAVKVPVWAKLTPNTSDPALLAAAAESAGADAISAINTVRALAIDPVGMRPVLYHGLGGLSGPAIKPIGLAFIWQAYEKVRIPLVGIGGITTPEDAFEYLLAGATLLEVGTAVADSGGTVFHTLADGLREILKERGFGNVAEAVGAAHRK
ncbi:MAG: dihydroorotate dehydrogenase [Candidatus Thermoplasmatota archaeon]|jgi:dihydroorotate dehydrogenase (NAD+) catalytic subunit|nr:dihydroorotate dehydrogenase [Candidatus Thermoplasmatota archaeon]